MTEQKLKGTVSFVNHEKRYATIEYKGGTRKKSITYQFEESPAIADNKSAGPGSHYFRVGDEVSFVIGMSARGDRQVARNVLFLYNTALGVLLNKAGKENLFLGYLKEADDRLYIKEINSYFFFPLLLSPWENWPDPKLFNNQVEFRLVNIANPKKLQAELLSSDFIPEYRKLQYHYNRKEPVRARVLKITPYAIHLDLGNDKIHGRISLGNVEAVPDKLQVNDEILVNITYLGKLKIAVEMAGPAKR